MYLQPFVYPEEMTMAMTTVRQLIQIKGNDVWSIGPDDSVFDALRLMSEKNIGACLVMVSDKLVGIMSERDYARKVILFGKTSKETYVREIMSSKVVTIHPDQTMEECMEIMTKYHIRHLPVVADAKVEGIISIGDVVRDIIYQQRKTIKEMEKYVTG